MAASSFMHTLLGTVCLLSLWGTLCGQFIRTENNEVGVSDHELQRATVPDKPRSVQVTDSGPTMVVLDVEPPLENGGAEVNGFRVVFAGRSFDFNLDPNDLGKNRSQAIPIENLRPATIYIFGIRAKNEVGVSDIIDYVYQTEALRVPYPIVIISDPEGSYSNSYDIRWESPRTGGLPIKRYRIKVRKVAVYEGTFDLQKPLEDFTSRMVPDNLQRPLTKYYLENLKPDAFYQVEVTAYNDMGRSEPIPFIFHTK